MPRDADGSSPFRRASEAANANVVKLVLEHNADACDNSGTPQYIWRWQGRGCDADVTSVTATNSIRGRKP